MSAKRLTPPIKWHGGKTYLAQRIIDLMPKHHHYVELFGGGLAVLLRKDPVGISEVVNDLNGELMNFFCVLQGKKSFARFSRRVNVIPFARDEWKDSKLEESEESSLSRVTRALKFFVRNRMSLAGRMTDFTGITKTRTRGGMNAEVNAWMGAVEGLPAFHARIKRVLIENRPAIDLMQNHDVKGSLMYCDPPYPSSTRSSPSVYEYEMIDKDHRAFLAEAKSLKHAKIMISSYPSEMYTTALKDWNQHEFDIANNAAGGKTKARKTEVVFTNF